MADDLSEGDIVLVDFEAWTDEGTLFDTTRPKVAEEAGWDNDVEVEAMPVILGGGRLVPGFEEALLEAELGVDGEVEVPPAKGFGEHDADQVRVFPRKEFEKAEIDPIPGETVEISNQRGTIIQATASRVRVDFNHPIAGKTLTYKYVVTERIEDDEGRLKALLGLDYKTQVASEFDIEVDGKRARVTVPERASNDPQWFMAKHRLGHDVFEHTDLDTVELVSVLEREEFESHQHGHGHGDLPPEVQEAVAEAKAKAGAGDEGADDSGEDAGDDAGGEAGEETEA